MSPITILRSGACKHVHPNLAIRKPVIMHVNVSLYVGRVFVVFKVDESSQ